MKMDDLRKRTFKFVIYVLSVWSILFMTFVSIYTYSEGDNNSIAIIKMSLLLIFVWVIILGIIQYVLRDMVKYLVNMSNDWKLKFFSLVLFMMLIKETIAVIITNQVSLFGGEYSKAFITVHSNYFIVMLFSVIVFIPMIIAWIYLLSKYDFKHYEAFLLFGLTGVIVEILINPFAATAGLWIFIYGLFIWLATYCLPERNLPRPGYNTYIIAVFLPVIASIPFAFIIMFICSIFQTPLFIA